MNSWEGLQSGHEFVMLEKLKMDISKLRHYAWASADYNTIHFDEKSAKGMGLPSVIVHGMYELGLISTALDELCAQIFQDAKVRCRVKKIETRFVGPALVDDELSISAKISSTTENSFTLQLFIYRNGDRTKLTAGGTARLEAIHVRGLS
jgi:acyl dehydratase